MTPESPIILSLHLDKTNCIFSLKVYLKMGTLILDFADQLYSFLALKYEISPSKNAAEGGPPIEEYDWPFEEFTTDIARAVMMLSYTYRPSFRRHFRSVASLLCTSKQNPKLYATIFANVTYRCHSPLKILILCSFISEMYLFIFFQKGAEDVKRHYTLPAMKCFNDIYIYVLGKKDDPIPKWDDVKRSATLIARGYDTLEPIMRTEHPSSESKSFFTSIQIVLEERDKMRSGPEDASKGSGNSAASAPSTSSVCKSNVTAVKSKSLVHRRLSPSLAADQLADQLKQASLTKRVSPKEDEKQKSHGKKSSYQRLKTKACARSAESASQAMASTSTTISFTAEHSLVPMGKNNTVYKTTIKPVAKNIVPSFRVVDKASQRVPGVGEDARFFVARENARFFEARFYEDHNSEATNESPHSSNTIADETRSGSSVAKAKSKKHKKKGAKK